MTANAKHNDEPSDQLPIPHWVRPLSIDEQAALIREAEDDIARGDVFNEVEANRRIDAMLARYRR